MIKYWIEVMIEDKEKFFDVTGYVYAENPEEASKTLNSAIEDEYLDGNIITWRFIKEVLLS